MENHEFDSIDGSRGAPFLNSLAAQYGLAAQSFAVSHPSLPNYIALTSGSTFGIHSDCTDCNLDVPNLADQVESSGRRWRSYQESMPGPCFLEDYADDPQGGTYAQKHNPFIYYDSIRNNPARCANIVPLSEFPTDLAVGRYDLMWIEPNMCHSTHDCSIAVGDTWLKGIVSQILNSNAFLNDGVLFITYDEGTSNAGCCQNAAGGRIFTAVVSPLARRGFRSSNPYDHYSLLATIEAAWGLPRLGKAGCDCSPTMSEFFAPR